MGSAQQLRVVAGAVGPGRVVSQLGGALAGRCRVLRRGGEAV